MPALLRHAAASVRHKSRPIRRQLERACDFKLRQCGHMGAAKTHASLVANYGDGRIRIFSCRWGGNSGGFAYFASSFTSDSSTSCSLRSSASLVKGLARRVTPESASPGCVKPVYPDI